MSSFSRKFAPGGTILATWLFLLFLLGCRPPVRADLPASTFIYGKPSEAVTLDPGDFRDLESAVVIANLFDTLVRFEPGGKEIRPGLAAHWEHSPDGRVWTFHLRPGVRFHDGIPCNAAAVKFNYDRQRDPRNPYRFGAKFAYWSQLFGHLKSVDVPAPNKVVFTLSRPDPIFLSSLATLTNGILSPAAIRRYRAEIGRHPVGTGPFRFVSWTPGQRIVLQANRFYWGGSPRVQRLIFESIPDNTVRLMKLAGGRIHGMEGINPDDAARIRRNPDLRLLAQPGLNLGYLAFNLTRPPLQDVRVRRAIALALNKQSLVRAFFAGGTIGQSPRNLMPPTVWGYDGSAPEAVPDPEQARRLLSQAGWSGGSSLSLWVPSIARPYLPGGQEVAQAIQADMAKVGIRTRIVTYEWGTFLGNVARGEHDLLLLGWTGDRGDPDDFLYTLLHSRNAVPGSATNKAFYRNRRVDALLEEGRQTMDQTRRAAVYQEVQAIARRDLPYVPLFAAMQLVAVRRNVSGIEIYPTGWKEFKGVEVGTEK